MSNQDAILRKCRETLPGGNWLRSGIWYIASGGGVTIDTYNGEKFTMDDDTYTATALRAELSNRAEELAHLLKG